MNAELSRKRKVSVAREDAQSSRGPQKRDCFKVRAPAKVRKLRFDSKPYKSGKSKTGKVPKSHKRAHSDSDLNTGHTEKPGKKIRPSALEQTPCKSKKLNTEKVAKSHKRAHSDSDLNTDHSEKPGKKIRPSALEPTPCKSKKFQTEKVAKSHKRAHSDSDLNTDHSEKPGKKLRVSTQEPTKKTEVVKDGKDRGVPEPSVTLASTSNGPVRRKKTRRGKRGGRRRKGLSEYEMGKPLGSGGFGDVYAARRKRDNLPVAIKFVNNSKVKNYREINGRQFPGEAFYQRHVRHPNVIGLLDMFNHEDKFVFVLERPENSSDLFDYIDGRDFLAEDEGRRLFTNILDAAIECEKQSVIHRDIKPENIILDLTKMEAKLTDFGLACDAQEAPFRRFVGTQHYCPPEFYSHHSFLGNQATVWQLGFLLAEMITGEMPYVKPRMALYMKPSISKHVSKGARSLILWMLSRDPDERPTLQQVRRHAWINKTRQH